MNDRAQNKAFTLVEMLIGMALISLIVTMVYGSYAATTRTLEAYGSRMTCSDRAHLVLRLMARQLRCAYAPPQSRPGADASPRAGHGSQPAGSPPVRGISASSAVSFQGDSREASGEILCFLTTGGLSQGPDKPGGLARLRYRYETHSGVLSLCDEPPARPSTGPGAARVWRPVLGGVTGIDLEFHDGQRWQPRWDSREAGRLPRAVKIVLTLAEENGRTRRYETAVPIACRSSTPRPLRGVRTGQP